MEGMITRQAAQFCIVLLVIALAMGLVLLSASLSNYFKKRAVCIKQVGLRNKMLTVQALMEAKACDAVSQVVQRFIEPRKTGEWTAADWDIAREEALDLTIKFASTTKIYTGERLLDAYQSIEVNAQETLKALVGGLLRKQTD